MLLSHLLAVTTLGLALPSLGHAQQTVFNVPSADFMEKGTSHAEWDAVAGDTKLSVSVTPRIIEGFGHGLEGGVNVSSVNLPVAGGIVVTPALKAKLFESVSHGFLLFVGDNLSLPVRQRTYHAGNYVYLAAARTFHCGTRLTVGAYDFTANVIDRANRGGIQAAIEQPLNRRITLATDWYSGNTSAGFVTSGLAVSVNTQLTLLGGVQMGNSGLLTGNHSLLFVLGWNPKRRLQPE